MRTNKSRTETNRNATSNAVQCLLQTPYHLTVAVYNEYGPSVAELLRPAYALAVRVLSLITSVAAIIAIHLVRDVLAGIGTCGMVSTNRVTDAYASPLGWGSTDTPSVVSYAPLSEVVEEPSYRLTDSDILEALEAQPFDMPMTADDYSDEWMSCVGSSDHNAHVEAYQDNRVECCVAGMTMMRQGVVVELEPFNAEFPLPINPNLRSIRDIPATSVVSVDRNGDIVECDISNAVPGIGGRMVPSTSILAILPLPTNPVKTLATADNGEWVEMCEGYYGMIWTTDGLRVYHFRIDSSRAGYLTWYNGGSESSNHKELGYFKTLADAKSACMAVVVKATNDETGDRPATGQSLETINAYDNHRRSYEETPVETRSSIEVTSVVVGEERLTEAGKAVKASSKPAKARSPRKATTVKPVKEDVSRRNQRILEMSTKEGMSSKDIAAVFGLSLRTVQQIVKKAKGS